MGDYKNHITTVYYQFVATQVAGYPYPQILFHNLQACVRAILHTYRPMSIDIITSIALSNNDTWQGQVSPLVWSTQQISSQLVARSPFSVTMLGLHLFELLLNIFLIIIEIANETLLTRLLNYLTSKRHVYGGLLVPVFLCKKLCKP